MNAISVLKNDHRQVERLFDRFERSRSTDERGRIADTLVRELSVHAAIEEQLVYPRLKQALDGEGAPQRARSPSRTARRRNGRTRGRDHGPTGERRVFLALEEHHFAKVALLEIERLAVTDSRFEGKVLVLADHVRRHIEEEERELLPVLERTLSAEELDELGDVLHRAKKLAPTRPHPAAPDEPPANLVAGAAASAYDRALLAVSRVMAAARGAARRAFQAGADRAGRARRSVGETARDAKEVARSARHASRAAREEARAVARTAADVARESTAATVQ